MNEADRPLRIDGQLWFNRGEKGYLGGKRIDLLEQIEATGSISRAAKAIKLSYKAAWDAVDAMNNLSERPLVICSAGGAQGGGTRLTDFGREMLHVWRRMQAEYERFLAQVAEFQTAGKLTAEQASALTILAEKVTFNLGYWVQ